MMSEDDLKRAAWRIIQLTTFVDTPRHGKPQVWGHDTTLGTPDELIAEAVGILREELGLRQTFIRAVSIEPKPLLLAWKIDCFEGASA